MNFVLNLSAVWQRKVMYSFLSRKWRDCFPGITESYVSLKAASFVLDFAHVVFLSSEPPLLQILLLVTGHTLKIVYTPGLLLSFVCSCRPEDTKRRAFELCGSRVVYELSERFLELYTTLYTLHYPVYLAKDLGSR